MFDAVISPLESAVHHPPQISSRRVPRPCAEHASTRLWTPGGLCAALLVLTPLLAASPARAGNGLTLRVNDVDGAPGSLIAVEVRTYAPRGVGQGQICLFATSQWTSSNSGSFDAGIASDAVPLGDGTETRLRERTDGVTSRELVASSALRPLAQGVKTEVQPLLRLEGVTVLSGLGDVVSDSWFDAGIQTADVDFSSPSASINEADGPMVVFYFRLDENLTPGQEFQLALDPADTFLVDAQGDPLPLELKPGRLRIKDPEVCHP
jgi:hypothetical protein